MIRLRRRFTICYHPKGYTEITLDVNPYLPLCMQDDIFIPAILDKVKELELPGWTLANVHDDNYRCVYTYINPGLSR